MKPYQQTPKQLAITYETDLISGLTSSQVTERLLYYGRNELKETVKPYWWLLFLRQFQSPLIYILLVAAAIIAFVGHVLDASLVSGILLFNAIIGTVQEGKSHDILQKLQKFIPETCVVIREQVGKVISARELVPGDLVELHAGEKIPADMRIVEAFGAIIDESLLTGESTGIAKDAQTIEREVPLFEQRNMLFKGTYFMQGFARALVVATGNHTYLGSLQQQTQEAVTETPLQQELNNLSKKIIIAIICLCGVLFGVGAWMGQELHELLIMLTALLICVIPEGLPVVLTLILVTGAYRMMQKKMLVKKLPAVEGLGQIDVIVVDKTGTLTHNELMVEKVYVPGAFFSISGTGYHSQGSAHCVSGCDNEANQRLQQLARAALLLDTTQITFDNRQQRYIVQGEPIEAACGIFARKIVPETHLSFKRVYEMPFNQELRMRWAVFVHEGAYYIVCTGAPEKILNMIKIPSEQDQKALDQLLQEGLRTMAFAQGVYTQQSPVKDWLTYIQSSATLELLGFCGMQDTIRSDVRSVVEQIRKAGLEVIMATGDHAATAAYVAESTGIISSQEQLLTGPGIEAVTGQRLLAARAFARVTPQDKVVIINAYHAQHKRVAMTGDGINDVISLTAADIGIAMGSGTDVAQEAADLVLLDNQLKTIFEGIKEGRHIIYTLRRVILYFFATNLSEVLVVLGSFMLRIPLPIEAVQILWLNLVTDGFLDSALAMEPYEVQVIEGKRTVKGRHIIDATFLLTMLWMAIPMVIGSLWVLHRTWSVDIRKARTMLLVCLALFQWFNAWNCRSETVSLLRMNFFANRWLIAATLFVLVLQILVVYVPWLQYIFKTVPLGLYDWLMVSTISSTIIIWDELRKACIRWRD